MYITYTESQVVTRAIVGNFAPFRCTRANGRPGFVILPAGWSAERTVITQARRAGQVIHTHVDGRERTISEYDFPLGEGGDYEDAWASFLANQRQEISPLERSLKTWIDPHQ